MWGGEESVGAKFESGQDVLPHSTILTDAELSSRTDK
jgi:hypothetical protein